MTHTRRAEVVPLYHVPRSQVWEGSRGRQSGRVHLHVNGRALCGVRSPWYPRDPLISDQRCSRCEARAERNGIAWPLAAGDQGERPDGTGRVAPADGCAERQSTADPSPAASAGPGSEQSSLTESGSAGLPDTPAEKGCPTCGTEPCPDCQDFDELAGGSRVASGLEVASSPPADSQEDNT